MNIVIKNANKMNLVSLHSKDAIVPEFDFGIQQKQVRKHIQ